jgi:SNF2 family DNA or RNA helicase
MNTKREICNSRHDASADWSEPGVGKSLIALAKIAILSDLGLIHKTLIICPKTVMLTWDIEIKKHTNLKHIMLTGTLDKKIKELKRRANIYSLTYDSLPGRARTRGRLLRAIARGGIDFLVADEATLIKSRTAQRSAALTVLGDLIPRKLFLSGTPVTNDPTSILNIYRALDGGKTFNKNYFAARSKYFKNIGSFYPMWVPRDLMKEELSKKMYSIAIRITKDECLDLPEKVWSNRYMELSNEQRRYYVPIAKGILKILDTTSGKVKIRGALDGIGKLSQLLSGFMYTQDGAYHLNPNPKLELLEDVVDEFPKEEKIIIYCRWKEEATIISQWAKSKGYSYVTMTGETDSVDRAKYINSFQNGDTKLFICNVAVGKFSLTLTASSTIVYYSMGFGIEEFIQSSDRIHRVSQTRTCLYLPLLTVGGVDEYIFDSVSRKIKIAQAIVDPEFRKRLEVIK